MSASSQRQGGSGHASSMYWSRRQLRRCDVSAFRSCSNIIGAPWSTPTVGCGPRRRRCRARLRCCPAWGHQPVVRTFAVFVPRRCRLSPSWPVPRIVRLLAACSGSPPPSRQRSSRSPSGCSSWPCPAPISGHTLASLMRNLVFRVQNRGGTSRCKRDGRQRWTNHDGCRVRVPDPSGGDVEARLLHRLG